MRAFTAVAAALVFAASAGAAGPPTLRVFAASSLTEVFPTVDVRPDYSFAGSNQLAFQIRQGAPADVFASASPDFTRRLYRERLVERPRVFAANELVLAVPRSNPARLRTVFDLRTKPVKLVVGTPQVPVGAYTRAVLRRLGLSGVLAKAVSLEPDVKGIVGKLALGEADAGFVYRTDVRAASDRLRAIALPPRSRPRVRYEVAVVRSSRSAPVARAWVARLLGARAQRLLREAGFHSP